MIQTIFENCIPMLEVIGAYAIVFIINMFFGIYTNVIAGTEKFQIKKILKTLSQIIVAAIAGVGIVIGFNLMRIGLENFGFLIDEILTNTISIFTFVVLFTQAFIVKAKDIYEKIRVMTDVELTVEEANEIVVEYRKPKIETIGFSAEGIEPKNESEGIG